MEGEVALLGERGATDITHEHGHLTVHLHVPLQKCLIFKARPTLVALREGVLLSHMLQALAVRLKELAAVATQVGRMLPGVRLPHGRGAGARSGTLASSNGRFVWVSLGSLLQVLHTLS